MNPRSYFIMSIIEAYTLLGYLGKHITQPLVNWR